MCTCSPIYECLQHPMCKAKCLYTFQDNENPYYICAQNVRMRMYARAYI